MKGFFDLQRHIKWYMKRTADKPNPKVISKVIEAQVKMLAPFCPHLCEEIWEKLGHEDLISLAEWPEVDENKINQLRNNEIPIYEPGLEQLVTRNQEEERLRFTTNIGQAVETSDVVFIAVGTPPDEDGSADLQHVLNVARMIGDHMNRPKVVITKSTVPVGTADKVRAAIRRGRDPVEAYLEFGKF